MTAKKITLRVDTALYPRDAVQAAAYTFTDRACVAMRVLSANKLEITLEPKSAAGSAALKGEFLNELLHHALRHKIAANNRHIREYIVTQALVGARPPDEKTAVKAGEIQKKQAAAADEELEKEIDRLLAEVEKSDYKNDPLGIAVPWEEKYGKKKKQ